MARVASSAGADWYLQSAFVEEPEYYGSTMIFYQTSTPIGWTKDTTKDNIGLRLVSGLTGGSTGGSTNFTTVYPSTTASASGTFSGLAASATNPTTLTEPQIPVHTHPSNVAQFSPYPPIINFSPGSGASPTVPTGLVLAFGQQIATTAGPSGAHNHTTPAVPGGTVTISQNRAIRYADVIIATKDIPP